MRGKMFAKIRGYTGGCLEYRAKVDTRSSSKQILAWFHTTPEILQNEVSDSVSDPILEPLILLDAILSKPDSKSCLA